MDEFGQWFNPLNSHPAAFTSSVSSQPASSQAVLLAHPEAGEKPASASAVVVETLDEVIELSPRAARGAPLYLSAVWSPPPDPP